MNDSPIGLIGIGLLGTALAERMIAAGLTLVGYDCDRSVGDRLRTIGGRFAAKPGDVASACNQIVFCLPDSDVVAGVMSELGDCLTAGRLLMSSTNRVPDCN